MKVDLAKLAKGGLANFSQLLRQAHGTAAQAIHLLGKHARNFQIPDSKFRISNSGFRVPNSEFRQPRMPAPDRAPYSNTGIGLEMRTQE